MAHTYRQTQSFYQGYFTKSKERGTDHMGRLSLHHMGRLSAHNNHPLPSGVSALEAH